MEKDTTKKKTRKIANIVFWVVLAIVAIYSVVALVSTDDGTMNWFGKTAFTVQTDSMVPTFEKGDLIFVDTDFDASDIVVGDVITYVDSIDVDGDGENEVVYNSHRVTDIVTDQNNYLHFVTKGDNNPSDDQDSIHESAVIGIWIEDGVVKNIGGIVDGIVGFLKSGTGFFIFIVLPCFAFLVYEIIRFMNVWAEYKGKQNLTDRVKIQEEALAIARAQLEEEARQKALEKEKENTEE